MLPRGEAHKSYAFAIDSGFCHKFCIFHQFCICVNVGDFVVIADEAILKF
jgi:hypothetical protein